MADATVERLDFSKPPAATWLEGDGYGRGAIPEAWSQYKVHYDPPGLMVCEDRGKWWWATTQAVSASTGWRGQMQDGGTVTRCEARAAAWAWHDRRLKLVLSLEDVGVQIDMWPTALLFDDNHCRSCEQWLGRGPAWGASDFPNILRDLSKIHEDTKK